MEKKHFDIQGMTCASCQAHVTKAVEKLEGTKNVNVNLLTNDMTLEVDKSKVDDAKIIEAIENAGYGASVAVDAQVKESKSIGAKKSNKSSSMRNRVQESNDNAIKDMKLRLRVSLIFWIPLMVIAMHNMLHIPMPIFDGIENSLTFVLVQLLLTIPVIIANRKMIVNGFRSLVKFSHNMDTLVAIGSGASFIYSCVTLFRMTNLFGHQDIDGVSKISNQIYFDSAATILTLITLGKYFEAKSKGKTGDAITKLINLAPKKSIVVRDGKEVEIQSEEILEGDIIVIKPGSSIPVDGVIIEGSSNINQSAITGESMPIMKTVGDSVVSGTVNENGTFKMKALKVGDETTLAKIVKLVEDASSSKAPIENLADRIAYYFVQAVISIAIITFAYWLINGVGFALALNFAVSVLVISCPCALGLATPVAIMVGTGKGAENGILFKNAEALQTLGEVKYVLFDKTGTITTGKPVVTDIETNLDEGEFLSLAYSMEKNSEHPLAKAVVRKARKYKAKKVDDFRAISGKGLSCKIDGEQYFAGNIKLMQENKIDTTEFDGKTLSKQGKTVMYFANSKELIGIIAVADTVKPDSKEAVDLLHKLGVKTAMVTGDNRVVAEEIAKEAGISEVHSEVLPEDKEKLVRKLKSKKRVAFVGDGINDSPALTSADIGIAIGSGTDIAIESADVILVRSSLIDVVNSIKLSKKTLINIKENLFWAFFYNAICIPIAAGCFSKSGITLNPMIGALAMSMSSIFVVTNALRLRFVKMKKVEEEKLMKEEIKIEGMMCENCVKHVTKALEALDGITKVEVSLENKNAIIETSRKLSDDEIKNAIDEAGYKVTEIK